VIAAYFGLQVVLRLTLGSSLELDEAEQMVLGQRLQAGYTGQPPLYTWLQIGFFAIFGQGVLALALLKNLLLFLTYAGTYFAARTLGLHGALAAAAALSLLLLTDIGWESQRDLTHSVLVTSIAALTLWLGCVMVAGLPQPRHYLLLGLLIGLGTLSKLNYLFFLAALICALFSIDRRLILRPAFVLSVVLAAALLSPYATWVSEAPAVATSSLAKLDTAGPVGLGDIAPNLATLAGALAQFCVLFVVLFLALVRVWPRGWSPLRGGGRAAPTLLLLRLFWFALAILFAYVVVSGAATFRGRWLMPLLFYLPVLFFALAPAATFTETIRRRYARLLLTVALLVSVGLLARVYLGPLFDKFAKPHFPAAALAQALDRQAGPGLPIVAMDSQIAGNLRHQLPARFVSYPPVAIPLPTASDVVLVWNADKDREVPDRLIEYLRQQSLQAVLPSTSPEVLEVPLRLSRTETFRLAWQRVKLSRWGAASAKCVP
jgi:4-amino-4-deoxy-L-arabinose transferase-like glycosyltransferase